MSASIGIFAAILLAALDVPRLVTGASLMTCLGAPAETAKERAFGQGAPTAPALASERVVAVVAVAAAAAAFVVAAAAGAAGAVVAFVTAVAVVTTSSVAVEADTAVAAAVAAAAAEAATVVAAAAKAAAVAAVAARFPLHSSPPADSHQEGKPSKYAVLLVVACMVVALRSARLALGQNAGRQRPCCPSWSSPT